MRACVRAGGGCDAVCSSRFSPGIELEFGVGVIFSHLVQSKVERMKENATVTDFEMSADDMSQLDRLTIPAALEDFKVCILVNAF